MRTVILIATLLAGGRFVQAQATGWPNTRQGFWISLGVGDGSARINCTYFCLLSAYSRHFGHSGHVRLGSTLSPNVLFGGEATGWLRDHYSQDVVVSASAVALWYPKRAGAAYLKVGVGGTRFRRYHATRATLDGMDIRATAPSVTLGVGYEARAGRGVSLAPWVTYLASPTVPLHGFTAPPLTHAQFNVNILQGGLGVTWH
jgi:hypothetical protein